MRASRTVALFALPAIAHAVTLSDFAPRADQNTLTSACNSVYTADIPNCLPKDFQNPPCSASCVHGMVDIAQQVQSSCPNHKGDDVIAAFLAGGGPKRLCPNADDVLGASGGAQACAGFHRLTRTAGLGRRKGMAEETPQINWMSEIEDVPEKVGRRNVIFELADEVGMDKLSAVLKNFMNAPPPV